MLLLPEIYLCEHGLSKYLQDLRSACRDRLRSRGVVLDEGPCVAVFTKESSRASSPSPIISAIASSPRLRALPANESKVNHPAYTERLMKHTYLHMLKQIFTILFFFFFF